MTQQATLALHALRSQTLRRIEGVALIACSASKSPARAPARHLYTGPAGETCGTCGNYRRRPDGPHSCALVRSDRGMWDAVCPRAPACLAWQSSKVS